jgi:hypothetical protein
MLRTLSALQGVNVLTKEAQKKIKGRGPCGVKVNGTWCTVDDYNGSGGTRDDAQAMVGTSQSCSDGSSGTVTNWCCDSCYWN